MPESAGAVRVKFDGDIETGFEFLDEVVGGVGCKQAAHVLNANAVATHLLKFFRKLNEHFIRVNGAYRVDKAALNFGLFGASKRGFDCDAEIANVVKRVENAEDADTVSRGVLNKFFHHVIRVVIVAEQILSAQEHLNRGFEVCLKLVETFPRIFVQKSQAGVEGRAAPRFQSFIADFVQACKHRLHLTITHARGAQRLMSVAQNSFHDLNRFRHKYTLPKKFSNIATIIDFIYFNVNRRAEIYK